MTVYNKPGEASPTNCMNPEGHPWWCICFLDWRIEGGNYPEEFV